MSGDRGPETGTARPRRPRVGVDLRALVPQATGIGVHTHSLLSELQARGNLDYLGLAHREPGGAAGLREAGLEVEWQSSSYGVLWQQLTLPKRLARGDIDLFWSPIQTLPLRLPIPGVVTVHDLTPILHPETHRLKVRLSQLPFLRASLRRARRIVVVSQATANDLRGYCPEISDRIEVVYNGVDRDFLPGTERQIAETRAELGSPDGYVLFTGTLEPRKNVGLLLDVWSEMRRDDRSTPPLVLAGGYGWRSRDLLRRIEQLEAEGLQVLGHVSRERLVKLYQAASLFVYPSLYEGFGLPPAEAMACGVPVITTRASSLPEVVGDAALLVEPNDGGDLRRSMLRILGDPGLAQRLGDGGPHQAGRFRWDSAAERLEDIFLSCLAGA